MIRDIAVTIDSSSWSGSSVPAAIDALSGPWPADVRVALIFLAYCTRPPVVTGFHLSDYWAFLRYLPAIDPGCSGLRLRPEWDTVDTQQKKLLSEELGVGFTAALLASKLGWLDIVDTRYAVETLYPGKFSLGSTGKQGPKKSPDYIAREASGGYAVLECKGSQTSRKTLRDAMSRGVAQKKNLMAHPGTRIGTSVVAGLFIPTALNPDGACVHICDPEWREIDIALAEADPATIDRALVQVSLAKSLSLAGIAAPAHWLINQPASDLGPSPELVRDSLSRDRERFTGRTVVFDASAPRVSQVDNAGYGDIPRTRFSIELPDALLDSIGEGGDVGETLDATVSDSRERGWKIATTDEYAEVTTPLGFVFRLDSG